MNYFPYYIKKFKEFFKCNNLYSEKKDLANGKAADGEESKKDESKKDEGKEEEKKEEEQKMVGALEIVSIFFSKKS